MRHGRLLWMIFTIFLFAIFSCSDNSISSDTEPPTVVITSPEDNSQFASGSVITIIADATDNKGIKEVKFYIDEEFVSLAAEEPYQYDWDSSSQLDTEHTIYAIAFDTNDNNTSSDLITITLSDSVTNQPPNSPSQPNPGNNATAVSTSIDLSWECSDPENDSLTYDVYFGAYPNPYIANTGQSETTYSLNSLDEETTYYWKIVAHDANSNSTTGEIWQFTSGTDSNQPPHPPSNPQPADNATFVSTNANISWECSDPEEDTLIYDVYFGTTSNPTLVNSGQSGTSYEPGTLNAESTYYWKIEAHDDQANSISSDIWQFTTNDSGSGDFQWCSVPAGDYTYGDPVVFQNLPYDFEIMKYPVTNQQYIEYLLEVVNAGSITVTDTGIEGYYEGDAHFSAGIYTFFNFYSNRDRIEWDGNNFSVLPVFENHPVTGVSWFGSWAFAVHYGYRLPTEEEWEKAARGDTGTSYPWGNSLYGSRANYWQSGDPWDNGTTPVGMYNGQTIQGYETTDSPSPYGVYDMAGNVQEWTDSWLTDISFLRVMRGGSFLSMEYHMDSWFRYNLDPLLTWDTIGIRCVSQ